MTVLRTCEGRGAEAEPRRPASPLYAEAAWAPEPRGHAQRSEGARARTPEPAASDPGASRPRGDGLWEKPLPTKLLVPGGSRFCRPDASGIENGSRTAKRPRLPFSLQRRPSRTQSPTAELDSGTATFHTASGSQQRTYSGSRRAAGLVRGAAAVPAAARDGSLWPASSRKKNRSRTSSRRRI